MPVLALPIAADYAFNGGDVTKSIGDSVGDKWKEWFGTNSSNFTEPGHEIDPNAGAWGGSPGTGEAWMGMAKSGIAGAKGNENYWNNRADEGLGPGGMAWESADLANREAESRGYDQAGALQLAREAAMGQAPSEAAYMMQQGLNSAIANQSAVAGGARGAAALAQAQGNMASNVANLQNQTFGQAGLLRAKEMAEARGMYGGLAGQTRQQDLERLGYANDIAKTNATNNMNFTLGAGNIAQGYGNQGIGWFNAGANVGNNMMVGGLEAEKIKAQNYNDIMNRTAGIEQAKTDAARAAADRQMGMVGSIVNAGGSAAGSMIPKPGVKA